MKNLWRIALACMVGVALAACEDAASTAETGADSGTPQADTAGGEDVGEDCTDADGDGYYGGACSDDCDDTDASINRGATEICGDGIDQDCSGADEVCAEACFDEDGDGYGEGKTCAGPDCDDSDPARHPGASEVCGNGTDEDCDGQDLPCRADCTDADKDGYGDGAGCLGTDCDDTDSDVHPGAAEVCGNDDDEDCDGQDAECPPDCVDSDGDGYGKGADCVDYDCDDGDKDVHLGGTEICGNGKDDDCVGGDEACPSQCKDQDGDGYGEGPDCDGTDCNDTDPAVHPGAADPCGDGVDQDCAGGDAECPKECVDGDEDGFGVGADCASKDCDDTDAAIHPGAVEVCGNGKDEDCNGQDAACVTCADSDGDGYGEGAACTGPDCNDNDPSVHPGVTEICGNGKDDDCTGGDEDCPSDCVDKDSDGYGVGPDCTAPVDCDDTDGAVSPGAAEVCGNGKDDDCTGGDQTCPEKKCATDKDCGLEQVCDLSTTQCRSAKVWEWWAPTIWQDVDADHAGLDLPTTVTFDGDAIVLNNGGNKSKSPKVATIYYSFVKTPTHWYLGYYLYYPWRWSSFGGLGTEYDNALRAVVLVVEQNGSTYGKLVMMLTTNEDVFRTYVPTTTALTGGSKDGNIRYDASGHHPLVYAHTGDHDLFGDSYTWNNVSNWEVSGFPGGDGVVYSWANKAGSVKAGDPKATYDLVAVVDALWPKRFAVGGGADMYETFGQWASNDAHARSLAPWRLNDVNTPTRPAGELLFDPADLARTKYTGGWGPFSYEYVYNPYAVRVNVDDLFVSADAVSADPLGGKADPFFTVWLRDGAGKEFRALDIFYGLQNNWHGVDIPATDYPLDMHKELGRYFFFGIEHPDHDLVGVDLKDDDGGLSLPDWLMSPKQTYYTSVTGKKLLDFGVADSYFTITKP